MVDAIPNDRALQGCVRRAEPGGRHHIKHWDLARSWIDGSVFSRLTLTRRSALGWLRAEEGLGIEEGDGLTVIPSVGESDCSTAMSILEGDGLTVIPSVGE